MRNMYMLYVNNRQTCRQTERQTERELHKKKSRKKNTCIYKEALREAHTANKTCSSSHP